MRKKSFGKYLFAICTLLITFLCFQCDVLAADKYFNVCNSSGVVKIFQIVGYGLAFLKIVIPILLMVMTSIGLGKAVLSSDDKAISNAVSLFVKRAIAAVVIFFIPSLLSFVFGIVDKANVTSEFNCLSTCIASPDKCKIPKDGGVFGSDK